MTLRIRILARAAVLALLVAAGLASAGDAPHDAPLLTNSCRDCHIPHASPGAGITKTAGNANLCNSCHALQSNPSLNAWSATDQAIPGTSGSSHRWSNPATAPQFGAQLPSATVASQLSDGALQCSACHNQHSQASAPFDPVAPASGAGRHFVLVPNNTGQLCIDCHAPWNQTSAASATLYTTGTASFTSGSPTVTGSGTAWAGNVQPGWRIKPLNAAATAWAVVQTVTNTSITLAASYAGATTTGQAYVAKKALSHPVGVALVASDVSTSPPREAGGARQVAGSWGTATGGNTTSLVDSSKTWVSGAEAGRWVRFTSGVNRGTTRQITANTATQLTFAAAPSAIVAGTMYEVDVDGNLSNNVALVNGSAASFTTGNVACQSCHSVHYGDSSAATYDDRPRPGDGHLLRRAAAETCDACHPNTLMHSSANLGTKHGTWGASFTCLTCHQPHGTGNVNLVRESIATPNSGTKDVDLRAIGGGVEAFGLASTTAGTGACEVCHTNTRNGSELTGATSSFTAGNTSATLSSTAGIAVNWEVKRSADPPSAWTRVAAIPSGTTLTLATGGYRGATGTGAWQAANPRFRNTGSGRGAAGTEHYVSACLGCHPHKDAFKGAGESNGNAACDGCHADITARVSGASSTTFGGAAIVSRHRLQGFAASDSGLTWSSPLSSAANVPANRSCVNMCHGDHPHDLTSPVVTTHDYNAYLDATSSASRANGTRTSATRARTDFDAAAPNGGMCVSCHRNPIVTGGFSLTPSAYGSSAHNYSINFVSPNTHTWGYSLHDSQGTFARNCTKCHADRADARPNDGTFPFAAVHFSSNPSLLAGNVNPAKTGNVVAENICYNCHGDGTNGQNLSGKNLWGEVTSAFGHPVNSDAVHDTGVEASATTNNGAFSGTNRHVNCQDCHDPHQAQPIGSGVRAGSVTAYSAGADYTTGTAAGSRNGTAVTGAGTTWTAAMVGSAISWTADAGVWYGITAVGGATSLTIATPLPANRSGTYIIRGANADTLTDSSKTGGTAWTKNQFKGWTLKVVSGTQAGRTSAIYGSPGTATNQLLVKFPSALAVGDRYVITPTGSRIASGMPPGSPAMAGAWGVQPTFGTPATPASWNDSGGCGTADAANACETITTGLATNTYARSALNPPPEAYVCVKCHSAFAYGTTPPNSPSGQPNAAVDTWSNTAGAAMRQSDISRDANPGNVGHHAIFAKGRNQPMASGAAVSSVRIPNWPSYTGTATVSGTAVTLASGTWPTGLLPGWFIYIGNSNPANPSTGWYEVTAVTSDAALTIDRTCAAPSTCTGTPAYFLTPGLGATFVPPWGPWSVLECSDCHRSSTLSDPLGPHGSSTKWMLRGAEPQTFLGAASSAARNFWTTNTPSDTNNMCLNCHRRDVYGDFTFVPTPRTPVAGEVYTFTRQNHPADKDNGSSAAFRTRWGIECMNCHGGARQGAVHGINLGIGNGGTTAASYSGRRLLAGSSWYAVTRSSTTNAGLCWTKGATDAVDNCGHAHNGVAFESGAANYEYESTQAPGNTP